MSFVVRTWNVFHGNAHPPERRAFLREMVELVTADRPALVCLQEVPVWALQHLARWSGMTAAGAVAARPRLRSAEVGRLLTELNHGLLRSAVTGQANAILAAGPVEGEQVVQVSTRGERRVCQTLRFEGLLVGNVHVTPGAAGPQLERTLDALTLRDERVVFAGDLNVRPGEAAAYDRLAEAGFSAPLGGSIDQVLVRGLPSTPPVAWPEALRRLDGRVLSDHAPVEVRVG